MNCATMIRKDGTVANFQLNEALLDDNLTRAYIIATYQGKCDSLTEFFLGK